MDIESRGYVVVRVLEDGQEVPQRFQAGVSTVARFLSEHHDIERVSVFAIPSAAKHAIEMYGDGTQLEVRRSILTLKLEPL